ncbi:hypothetical protein H0H93_000417 [Arthromyces matolae]|nr:hypothetical protein H0H93_000417 [Arthromyces matolae]
MNPEERLLIQKGGQILIQSLADNVPCTLLYGLGHATLTWAIDVHMDVSVLNVFKASNGPLPLTDRIAAYNLHDHELDIVMHWIGYVVLYFVEPTVNDYFIVWRAWILLRKTHGWRWTPYALGVLCFISTASLVSTVSSYTNESPALVHVSDIGGIMSFIANFAATTAIGYILWSHFKTLPRNQKSQVRKNFTVWRILAVLVESGAVYAVLQIVYPALTLYLIHGPFSLAGTNESVISAVISDDLSSPERPDGEAQA